MNASDGPAALYVRAVLAADAEAKISEMLVRRPGFGGFADGLEADGVDVDVEEEEEVDACRNIVVLGVTVVDVSGSFCLAVIANVRPLSSAWPI